MCFNQEYETQSHLQFENITQALMRELRVDLGNTVKKLLHYCRKDQSLKATMEKKTSLYIQGILKRSKLIVLSEKWDKEDEGEESV